MHKEWLRYIGQELDKLKTSGDPYDHAFYESIEKSYLKPTVDAIAAYNKSKTRTSQIRSSLPQSQVDGNPGVRMEDVLGL